MGAVRRRLREAADAGEVLGIIYHGGSQAGAYREITPIDFDGEKVRARCHSSKAVKTFNISKIEIRNATLPSTAERAAEWSADYIDADRFGDPATIVTVYGEYLIGLGWHVKVTEDSESRSTKISLHSFFNNGKPRKGTEVAIQFSPLTVDAFLSENIGEINLMHRESKRPWSVSGRRVDNTRTYTKADSAVMTFIEFAEKHAPRKVSNYERPLPPKSKPVART